MPKITPQITPPIIAFVDDGPPIIAFEDVGVGVGVGVGVCGHVTESLGLVQEVEFHIKSFKSHGHHGLFVKSQYPIAVIGIFICNPDWKHINSLLERFNAKIESWLIDSGIVPLNWLLLRLSTSNAIKFPIEEGIVPLNWLLLRLRYVNAIKFPIEEGIVPLNWLKERSQNVNAIKFPIEEGIVPLNWFSTR